MPDGNGTPHYRINATEVATGHVVFEAGDPKPPPDQLPYFLNHAVCDWQKENSQAVIRSALGIVEGGNTIAIHLWFDTK